MSEDKGFLARWAKRKQEALREAEAPKPAADARAPEPIEAETPEFDLASLPSLEEITEATDIKLFLQKGVPESLRNAALRRAWALDPAVRDYVGEALDYAYDWNKIGGVPGNGELAAGYNVAEAVSRLMSDLQDPDAPDPVTNKDVIENAASQHAAPEVGEDTTIVEQAQVGDAPMQESVLVPKADFEESLIVSKADTDVAVPKAATRRHGSALPHA